jgi:hypothetical protein
MIKKKSRLQRQLVVFSSMAGSTTDLAQGLWRSGGARRWLIPLAVFLCLTGAILVLAAGVEALAPFVYAIF